MRKLFILDWNGTLQDDMHHIYECGVQRIFRHFQLPCPDLDAFRNQVTGDFMNSFYWPNGIPPEVTAKDLDLIMRAGFKEKGRPPDLFSDAAWTVNGLWLRGHPMAIVSAYDEEKLVQAVESHGLTKKVETVRGSVRDKTPVFRQIMSEQGIAPADTYCVGDQVQDAEAAIAAGAQAIAYPHGFHSRERLQASGLAMTIIEELAELVDLVD